jgi:hypothetical protein
MNEIQLERQKIRDLLEVLSKRSSLNAEREKLATENIPEDAIKFGGHSYKVITESMSWEDANEYCEEQGGILLCVNDRPEMHFVRELLSQVRVNTCLVGLKKEDGAVEWISGGKPPEILLHRAWSNAENGTGGYIKLEGLRQLAQGFIQPLNGEQRFPFVCEWPR